MVILDYLLLCFIILGFGIEVSLVYIVHCWWLRHRKQWNETAHCTVYQFFRSWQHDAKLWWKTNLLMYEYQLISSRSIGNTIFAFCDRGCQCVIGSCFQHQHVRWRIAQVIWRSLLLLLHIIPLIITLLMSLVVRFMVTTTLCVAVTLKARCVALSIQQLKVVSHIC